MKASCTETLRNFDQRVGGDTALGVSVDGVWTITVDGGSHEIENVWSITGRLFDTEGGTRAYEFISADQRAMGTSTIETCTAGSALVSTGN